MAHFHTAFIANGFQIIIFTSRAVHIVSVSGHWLTEFLPTVMRFTLFKFRVLVSQPETVCSSLKLHIGHEFSASIIDH
jgi:hypothetical protein